MRTDERSGDPATRHPNGCPAMVRVVWWGRDAPGRGGCFRPPLRTARGFTLVEVAIVLGIVGLLLGALLTPLSTRFELTRLRQARGDLATAEEALYGFAMARGRLPCPDTGGDGEEDLNAGTCRAEEGNLPWTDLGVARSDPWGNVYRYRVDDRFADDTDGTGCGVATAGISFALCSDGELSIQDGVVGTLGADFFVVASGVPALAFSRGPNEGDPEAADSPDEMENTTTCSGPAPPPCDLDLYVSHEATRADGREFDDVLLWLSPHILKNRMVQSARLP